MKEKSMRKTVSDLIKIAAENSPKISEDDIELVSLDDAEKEMLVEEMYQLSDEFDDESYSEEGESIETSDKIFLIGLEDHEPLDIDCRACGFESCKDFQDAEEKEKIFKGPNCVFKILDLGMSLGYAWTTSEMHKVKPDISIKGGLAAVHLGLSETRICLAMTIKTGSN
ncbi:MAG: hypothetical protein KGY76_09520 [Candidatus Thermoplasmatota archaeon]|nr:hypothetical protein [Candidatus Thermoplasmatota archaeon]